MFIESEKLTKKEVLAFWHSIMPDLSDDTTLLTTKISNIKNQAFGNGYEVAGEYFYDYAKAEEDLYTLDELEELEDHWFDYVQFYDFHVRAENTVLDKDVELKWQAFMEKKFGDEYTKALENHLDNLGQAREY